MKKDHGSLGVYFIGSIVIILIGISIIWANVSESIIANISPFIIFGIIVIIFVVIAKSEEKKDKKKSIHHKTFGTMKHYNNYWSIDRKTSLTLWSKTYNVGIEFGANSINDNITETQESIYKDTIKTIIEKRTEVEKLIEDYYFEGYGIDKETLVRNADIHTITVEKSGISCISGGAMEDDEHDSFNLIIKPKIDIMTFEDYYDYKSEINNERMDNNGN